MCISVRNSLCLLLATALPAALSSCHSDTPEQEAQKALVRALTALSQGDAGAYLSLTDGYDEADSLHQAAYRLAAMQQHALETGRHGEGTTRTVVSRVEMAGDSAATAFYVSHFPDGDTLCGMQRLVHRGGQWKLAVGLRD